MRISMRIKRRMARPLTGTKGSPTNLYLSPELKKAARDAAKARYGCSLSDLVSRLLAKEISLKRGILAKA